MQTKKNNKYLVTDLIGVPLDLGSERLGVDMGPNALRYQGYVENLNSVGFQIIDLGNINCPSQENSDAGNPSIKYLDPVASVCEELSTWVERSIKESKKVIVLGGDHTIAIGSVAGAEKQLSKPIGLIWIDAHGDMNTQETTPSGNIHGMPLAVLLGYGHEKLVGIAGNKKISVKNMLGIGFKDLDSPEVDFINRNKLKTFWIRDILSEGLMPVFKEIVKLSMRVESIWVSIDLDAVDSDEAPGVGMPNKGGLTYREITSITDFIGKNCNVVGLDVVEYNPVNDVNHKTARLATEITAKIFGKEYTSYTDYLRKHNIK